MTSFEVTSKSEVQVPFAVFGLHGITKKGELKELALDKQKGFFDQLGISIAFHCGQLKTDRTSIDNYNEKMKNAKHIHIHTNSGEEDIDLSLRDSSESDEGELDDSIILEPSIKNDNKLLGELHHVEKDLENTLKGYEAKNLKLRNKNQHLKKEISSLNDNSKNKLEEQHARFKLFLLQKDKENQFHLNSLTGELETAKKEAQHLHGELSKVGELIHDEVKQKESEFKEKLSTLEKTHHTTVTAFNLKQQEFEALTEAYNRLNKEHNELHHLISLQKLELEEVKTNLNRECGLFKNLHTDHEKTREKLNEAVEYIKKQETELEITITNEIEKAKAVFHQQTEHLKEDLKAAEETVKDLKDRLTKTIAGTSEHAFDAAINLFKELKIHENKHTKKVMNEIETKRPKEKHAHKVEIIVNKPEHEVKLEGKKKKKNAEIIIEV